MNILFYFPTNKRSNSMETVMEELSNKGHRVFLLGTERKGEIHTHAESKGIETQVYTPVRGNSVIFHLRHILFLRKFVRKNRIDLVYSHTQPVNFYSVFAQFFSRARFIICRHHTDYIMKGTNRNAKLFDRVINTLGREFIVPSQKAVDQMVNHEHVDPTKIRKINLAYRFEDFPTPSESEVNSIREQYKAKMLLVTVSRFISCKRYSLLVEGVNELLKEGMDLKLLILGDGPLEHEIKEQVSELGLTEKIYFLGFRQNVMDYLKAASVVVHISESEASNSVIKESGFLEKLVIACEGVGDFNEYVENGRNGFLISRENPLPGMISALKNIDQDPERYSSYGKELKEAVMENFSVEHIIHEYDRDLE